MCCKAINDNNSVQGIKSQNVNITSPYMFKSLVHNRYLQNNTDLSSEKGAPVFLKSVLW